MAYAEISSGWWSYTRVLRAATSRRLRMRGKEGGISSFGTQGVVASEERTHWGAGMMGLGAPIERVAWRPDLFV